MPSPSENLPITRRDFLRTSAAAAEVGLASALGVVSPGECPVSEEADVRSPLETLDMVLIRKWPKLLDDFAFTEEITKAAVWWMHQSEEPQLRFVPAVAYVSPVEYELINSQQTFPDFYGHMVVVPAAGDEPTGIFVRDAGPMHYWQAPIPEVHAQMLVHTFARSIQSQLPEQVFDTPVPVILGNAQAELTAVAGLRWAVRLTHEPSTHGVLTGFANGVELLQAKRWAERIYRNRYPLRNAFAYDFRQPVSGDELPNVQAVSAAEKLLELDLSTLRQKASDNDPESVISYLSERIVSYHTSKGQPVEEAATREDAMEVFILPELLPPGLPDEAAYVVLQQMLGETYSPPAESPPPSLYHTAHPLLRHPAILGYSSCSRILVQYLEGKYPTLSIDSPASAV